MDTQPFDFKKYVESFLSDSLSKEKKIILRFFFYFSRLEYVIKELKGEGGDEYLFRKENGDADWQKFIEDERFTYVTEIKLGSLASIKKSNKNGKWGNVPNLNTKDALHILRNNLFHGGKYDDNKGIENGRNIVLLSDGIRIIEKIVKGEAPMELDKRFYY